MAAADGESRIRLVALGLVRGPRGVLLSLVDDPRADGPYWRALGGGIDVGETSAAALAREIEEETGLQAVVGRLVGVVEDRFVGFDGRPRHHIDLVHECALADPTAYDRPSIPMIEGGTEAEAVWVDPAEVVDGPRPLVPAGFARLLRDPA